MENGEAPVAGAREDFDFDRTDAARPIPTSIKVAPGVVGADGTNEHVEIPSADGEAAAGVASMASLVTNSAFLATVFRNAESDEYIWFSSFASDPGLTTGGWRGSGVSAH